MMFVVRCWCCVVLEVRSIPATELQSYTCLTTDTHCRFLCPASPAAPVSARSSWLPGESGPPPAPPLDILKRTIIIWQLQSAQLSPWGSEQFQQRLWSNTNTNSCLAAREEEEERMVMTTITTRNLITRVDERTTGLQLFVPWHCRPSLCSCSYYAMLESLPWSGVDCLT